MPYSLVVAHYREVGLKGNNRSFFERALASNIKASLLEVPGVRVELISGRVLIRPERADQIPEITTGLSRVFGLSSFSPAIELKRPQMGDLEKAAITLADEGSFSSFQVRAKRGNSSFEHTSQEVNVAVGQAIKDRTGAKVDLSRAEWTCHIELVQNRAFVYTDRLSGPGGMPVGSCGKTMALLSGGIDSPVAAWQIARRGAAVDFVHFHGQPYSDPSSARQASRLAKHLTPWLLKSRLWLIPFGEIQSEIVTSCPQPLRIVLYRRFMMRIAEALAVREGAQGLITGESLGQVASQTLPNLTATNDVVETLPVLRPLIAFDKIDIEAVAKTIGTYEISIEPHQDCCVLFVPRRVTTAAKPGELKAAESGLDVKTLVDKALEEAEPTDLRIDR